ncbi:MAG: C69 family dipeptidase, partial [Clostridia bacterium]|nr:C69 family dipeptidase [Clostridia bacterium]
SVLVAHTCDGWYDQRIQIIPGGTHPEGTMMDIMGDMCIDTRPGREPEKYGEIPQAAETYTYFHIGYPFMNEKQVMIGEHTWSGTRDVQTPEGWMYIANLEQLGLQRGATAREAIVVMGEMAEKYGYVDGGEALMVGDPDELWYFEVCGGGPLWAQGDEKPGAHWAAVRIPDDEIVVGANRSRIGVIDFEDTENYMWSTDITVLPEEMGWWSEGDEFNFNKIFNPEPGGYPFYHSRREWRVFSLLAPSQTFPIIDKYDQYDLSIKPDKPVTVQDIMTIYRDHLEGTDYDLTTDLAAGAYGNPNRWPMGRSERPEGMPSNMDWERAISMFRCSYSFVSQSRSWMPDPIGGVLWFGEDAPSTTVYVPIYCGVTELPAPWTQGLRHEFDRDSAWWAFNFVHNYANLRWDRMYELIREKSAAYEAAFFANQEAIETAANALYEIDPALAVKFINEYTYTNLDKVEKDWWDFAWHLVGRFYDGYEIDQETGSALSLGFSTEYLESVEFGVPALRDLTEIEKGRE